MYRFEVWAPFARNMRIRVSDVRHAMLGPDEQGWWLLELDSAGPGAEYGFEIDDDDQCYPDSRSSWQPRGVNALSSAYNHNAFQWTGSGFHPVPLAASVIYELHVGTFTLRGTFDGAIEKLNHLVELGVTHVELMPVASFAGEFGWGYDGVDLFAAHEPYGGPDGLKRFVNAAHSKGLAVLLDVVYNHFGPVGNYAGKFGPYLTKSHRTPWGGAVNLEEAWSHQVRRFFSDNALMWMRDFHIDGLRIDAVHAFIDRSAIHFLEQLAEETAALGDVLGRSLVLIAESSLNDPRIVTPRESGGFGFDAQWSDDFHRALFAVLDPGTRFGYYADFGSLRQLAKALEKTFVFDGIYSRFRRRSHGRPAAHLSQHRFLGYIQNHDQVGNRVNGDRIGQIAGTDRAKIAAAIVLLAPFVPMLFQGEEWAASSPFQYFADNGDSAIARSVSEGRRREFAAFGLYPESIPAPASRETFERSKLNWNELAQPAHAEMLDWYRRLIRLRRSTPALNNGEPGNTSVSFSEADKWLCIKRGNVKTMCNLGASDFSFALCKDDQILLCSRSNLEIHNSTLTLPADTIAVTSAVP
jgi:maltooligosyltrehalose trehalohydrolase